MSKNILIFALMFLVAVLGIPKLLENTPKSYAVISAPAENLKINFNGDFIESLDEELVDFSDKDAVITALFRAKTQGFTVYPSEGYYYFTFINAGERIKGNFRFDVQEREKGLFSFIYYKELAYAQEGTDEAQYFLLGQEGDGFKLVKRSDFEYEIQFENFKIPVHIYAAARELAAPKNIAGKEEYIGPIFDESGTRFDLVFDHANNKFLYVLNTTYGYNESYSTVDSDKIILIGTRSRFAYYNDIKNNRYVLIGVNLQNIEDNNYYDGPFDQLPDSFVDPKHLQALIEKYQPKTVGLIGNYGNFLYEEDTRFAIAPYLEYQTSGELLEYTVCNEVAGKRSELNNCLATSKF